MDIEPFERKPRRVFGFIALFILLIGIRVWYLAVTERETYVEEARRPRVRSLIEAPPRATIRDRYNLPLAVNKIQYNAHVLFAPIKQIPAFKWKINEQGKKYRFLSRKNYISSLARLLAEELSLDAQEIEDKIYSKAAIFPQTPCLIKENLTEKEYFKLKMMEKDWAGLSTERTYIRFYPHGKVAGDVIGYLGPIEGSNYAKIADEIKILETYLKEREQGELIVLPKGFNSTKEVRSRLKILKEKSYTLNDKVGKTGIEAQFEDQLRGCFGKKVWEIDRKGNLIREAPGVKPSLPGNRLLLTLSLELQDYAEQLLKEWESFRNPNLADPWIKGGAIVAMLPQTGEILTLASSPSIDANDFILKTPQVSCWLESKNYIADLWDGLSILKKECVNPKGELYEETLPLTWEAYLEFILSPNSDLFKVFQQINTLKKAYAFLKQPRSYDLSKKDFFLFQDLCSLFIKEELFTLDLIDYVGGVTLSEYREQTQSFLFFQKKIEERMKIIYEKYDFKSWREKHFAHYLTLKRKEEEEKNTYQKPFLDYLEKAKSELFKEFWTSFYSLFLETFFQENTELMADQIEMYPYLEQLIALKKEMDKVEPKRMECLTSIFRKIPSHLLVPYIKTFRSFSQLDRPLLSLLFGKKATEQDLAAAFYPQTGFGYARSNSYRQSAPQGSIFKLITGYAAMKQKENDDYNPLMIKDDMHLSKQGHKDLILGYFPNGETIYRHYKGGRLPRAHPGIGMIDIVGALEKSSNIYFSILAGDYLEEPQDLSQAARLFGYGEKTGIELPGEYIGHIPEDIDVNKTGLYAYAIGQHDLTVTPLQTAIMLSAFANKGFVLAPQILQLTAGKEKTREIDLKAHTEWAYQDYLSSIGIEIPFFTETIQDPTHLCLAKKEKVIKREVFLPEGIRSLLFEGMHKTLAGAHGTARYPLIKSLFASLEEYKVCEKMRNDVIGKTGTAEILHRPYLDAKPPLMREHAWFGLVSFQSDNPQNWENPELVVVVYLRFTKAGKIAAPLALKMVKKWREIQGKNK